MRVGVMDKQAVQLALDEINARGGIDGHPLRLVDRNDGAEGTKAAAIAEEFVGNDEVLAVVGHMNSAAMVAAGRIYDGHLAAIATTASSPDLSNLSPWVFRVISSDSTNGLDLARFAMSLGHKRAAILYENNSYGRGLMDSFRRGFRGEVIAADPIDADATDFEPYVAYLKSRAPDIVFVASTEASGRAILREAKRQQLASAFLGGDGWTGIVSDTAASQGTYVGAPFSPVDPRPEAQRFVAAYRARFGIEPDGNAALAYDATMLVAEAIERAGPDRAAVRDYLAALTRTPHAGVTGPISFQRSGDVVGRGFVMTRVDQGRLVVQRGGAS
jgi:branched-chain amino acid transport system substrate-binding protein